MFNADISSGRRDFPGDAQSQFHSMQLLSFPRETNLYTGHDYPPAPKNQHPARNHFPYSTVAEQKEKNKYLEDDSSEAAFVKWRNKRDKGFSEPRLVQQALGRCRAGRVMGKLSCCMLLMSRGFC
jgi:glyoxylase-like metal-dependent hydrolase (beta-lactamase superfamily II)